MKSDVIFVIAWCPTVILVSAECRKLSFPAGVKAGIYIQLYMSLFPPNILATFVNIF